MTAKNKLGGEEVKTWYYFSDIDIYYYKIFDDKYVNYYKNIYGIFVSDIKDNFLDRSFEKEMISVLCSKDALI